MGRVNVSGSMYHSPMSQLRLGRMQRPLLCIIDIFTDQPAFLDLNIP